MWSKPRFGPREKFIAENSTKKKNSYGKWESVPLCIRFKLLDVCVDGVDKEDMRGLTVAFTAV